MTDVDIQARIKQLEYEAHQFSISERTLKLLLVSAYGMLGNEFSRYFDVRIAESITIGGKLAIRWIERAINNHMNGALKLENNTKSFAVGGDTDSIYITLKMIVNQYLSTKTTKQIVSAIDKYCQLKIQPAIQDSYSKLSVYMNAYEQKMVMSREVIAERGLWRAKKNYVLSVWDQEGVKFEEPYMKIVGIECIKSSTPEICRKAITESIRLLMTSDEASAQAQIKAFRATFFAAPIEDISKNTSISKIDEVILENDDFGLGIKSYLNIKFNKKTAYHVKGAMVYNQMLIKHNLTQKYKTIVPGNKVRLIYLKGENPTRNNVISYPDILPPEFNLGDCVDVQVQYFKNFMSPVKSLFDLAGWDCVKSRKLF